VHHAFRGLLATDNHMNVRRANVDRVQGPTAMRTHSPNGLEDNAATTSIQNIRLLVHPFALLAPAFGIVGQPGSPELVVFAIDRSAFVAVKPLTITGPTDEKGDVPHVVLRAKSRDRKGAVVSSRSLTVAAPL